MRIPRMRAVLIAVCLTAAVSGHSMAQTAPAGSKSVDNETRLFQRFAADGAVTENVWLEGRFEFLNGDRVDGFSFGPVVAVNIAEDFELGGSVSLLSLDTDPGDTETGFSDLDLYGKIRLSTKPDQFALGVLLKLPTGDEKKFLGSGEIDVAFFGGYRHDFKSLSLVANAGLRINQDPDFPAGAGVAGPEGETSVQAGGAAIFPITPKIFGVVEAAFETERIDAAGSDLRWTLGGEYRANESFKARIGAVAGTGGSAPDYQLVASAVFLF